MSLQLRHWGRCGLGLASLLVLSLALAQPAYAQDGTSESDSSGTSDTSGSSDSSGTTDSTGTSETTETSDSDSSSSDGTTDGADGTDPSEADGTDPGQDGTSGTDPFPGEVIVRVEEDWLIDVADTNQANTAPEICTVFGPADPNTGLHGLFEMNHSTYPDFNRGGMQLQCWWGSWFLGSRNHYNGTELHTTVERITYTCSTEIKDGRLIMEITNGDSVTYGSFGGEGWLKLRLWTHRSNLNHYDASASVAHSRVTYGANRVNRFVRTEVRYYSADGDVFIDETDAYVHQLAQADLGPAPVNED